MLAQAIFAAGCFWGVQAAFNEVPGVISTEVGYIGGTTANPSYQEVSTGNTGYAEAVEVTFDTDKITYPQLLNVFFSIHNPTTKDRQGVDIGSQYRSAIFYLNAKQKEAAVDKITELQRLKKFAAPIVTEVVHAGQFFPAEDYHQNYLQKRGQKRCGI